jgi:hypothetical protein
MKKSMKREEIATPDKALDALLSHSDPAVRACAVIIREASSRRKRVLGLVQEALTQLRVDMKYLVFDLECTKRERDAARGGSV